MKQNFFKLFAVLALGAFICLPGMAGAYTVGGLEEGDWTGNWQENGIYNGNYQTFDKIEIFVIEGNAWQNPALINFNAADWHFDALHNPKYGVASGLDVSPTTSSLFTYSTVGFDPLTNPFIWDLVLWHGVDIVGAQRTTWNGGGWSYVELSFPAENRAAVPLPGAVLLLGAGMARLVAYARRRQDD
jgi:hypothetical protein